jgi:hypothetical protein
MHPPGAPSAPSAVVFLPALLEQGGQNHVRGDLGLSGRTGGLAGAHPLSVMMMLQQRKDPR